MQSSDLWEENQLLRGKLRDLGAELERERAERLKLKAENLWLKRLIQERALERSPEAIAEKIIEKNGEKVGDSILEKTPDASETPRSSPSLTRAPLRSVPAGPEALSKLPRE